MRAKDRHKMVSYFFAVPKMGRLLLTSSLKLPNGVRQYGQSECVQDKTGCHVILEGPKSKTPSEHIKRDDFDGGTRHKNGKTFFDGRNYGFYAKARLF